MANWDRLTRRGNVDDRRGAPLGIAGIGGTAGLLITIGVVLFNLLGGGGSDNANLDQILGQLSQLQGTSQAGDTSKFAGDDTYEQFAGKVLGSNNEMWAKIFTDNGKSYAEPRLVLFREATQSGCGFASAESGPHYCPNDQTIYLDETFFTVLTEKFGAKGGDLAEAYVISHEVGHHVQKLSGVLDKAGNSDQKTDITDIAIELQADCYAGLWAKSVSTAGVLEPNEIVEAMDAASAVGDDRIQSKIEGRVSPENWTHGSSAQRQEWFTKGYESGSPAQCNTFAT